MTTQGKRTALTRLRGLSAALGLALLVTLGVATPASATDAPLLQSGAGWLDGNGVHVCAPSTNTTCGGQAHVGGVSSNWWQCVELTQRLYKERGWYGGVFPGVSVATDIYDSLAAPNNTNGFTRQANGSITSVTLGDMLVFSGGGGPGHVGVIDKVTDNGNGTKTLRTVNQNAYEVMSDVTWNIGAKTVSKYGYMDGHSTDTTFAVMGVVHATSNTATASSTASNLHLSTVGTNGSVYVLDQTSPGTWSPDWTTVGGNVQSTSITSTSDGLQHIAAVGGDGNVYIADQQANKQWGAWNQIPAQVTKVAIAATLGDNKLHIATVGTNGVVYVLDQTGPGTWSPNWTTINGYVTDVSMTADPLNNKLHIASVGGDGNIYIVDQSPSTGAWGSWNQVLAQATRVAIAATSENKLHIATLGTNGSVYVLDQVNAGGAWSPNWTTISANVTSVSMAATSNGKLHIAAKGGDGNIYIVDQSPSTGAWGAWNQVVAQVTHVTITAG